MGDHMKKTRERLEEEFKRISSNETWTKDSLETMKNILKSMYYIDVICAMKEGEAYPGSENMSRMSGNSYGGRGSYDRGYDRGYAYDRRSYDGGSYDGGSYGRGGRSSGRRYYDDEKQNATQKLYQMMNNEQNGEVRMAIQNAIHELEQN